MCSLVLLLTNLCEEADLSKNGSFVLPFNKKITDVGLRIDLFCLISRKNSWQKALAFQVDQWDL